MKLVQGFWRVGQPGRLGNGKNYGEVRESQGIVKIVGKSGNGKNCGEVRETQGIVKIVRRLEKVRES